MYIIFMIMVSKKGFIDDIFTKLFVLYGLEISKLNFKILYLN